MPRNQPRFALPISLQETSTGAIAAATQFGQGDRFTHRTAMSFALSEATSVLAYVEDQLGHSSIQVTVDTYGHLIPGADIAWVDRLDVKTKPQQNATPAQLEG